MSERETNPDVDLQDFSYQRGDAKISARSRQYTAATYLLRDVINSQVGRASTQAIKNLKERIKHIIKETDKKINEEIQQAARAIAAIGSDGSDGSDGSEGPDGSGRASDSMSSYLKQGKLAPYPHLYT